MPRYIPKYHYTVWKDEMIFYALIPKISLQFFNSLLYFLNQFTIICYYLPEPTYSLNSDLKLLVTLSKVYAIFTFIFLISWSDTVLILIIWISRVSSSCSYREGGRERRRGYDSSTKSPLLSSVFNWYHQVYLPTDDPWDLASSLMRIPRENTPLD